MGLPKINTPINDILQPSTNKSIKFRPFLVKEEKILMMANESDDVQDKLNAIKQIINNCCLEELDVDKIPMFDIEYFFLKLREYSVGNIIQINLKHPNDKNSKNETCNHKQLVDLDISKAIIVKNENHDNKVELDKKFTLEMTYPKIKIIEKIKNFNFNNVDDIIKLIAECSSRLYDKESGDVYEFREYTMDEKLDFFGEMTQHQFNNIKTFFDTIPKVELKVEYDCQLCNTKQEFVFNGITAFL